MKRARNLRRKSQNENVGSDFDNPNENIGIPLLNDWYKKTRKVRNEPQLIKDLLPFQPGKYGIIAGRTGIGKTNLAFHLGFCLATGEQFFNLQCEKVGVAILVAEGDYQNLRQRLKKIGANFNGWENTFHFDFVAVQNPIKMLSEVVIKLKETPENNVVILDSAKYFVPGDYLKPKDVKEFVQTFEEVLVALKLSGIITLPISKPQDKKGLIRSTDIYSIKGATEWVDSATFGILIEKKAYAQGSDDKVTMSFAKHRIAEEELKDIDLQFDREKCMYSPIIEVQDTHISVNLDNLPIRKQGKERLHEKKETRKPRKTQDGS
jgi:hypothetical protein